MDLGGYRKIHKADIYSKGNTFNSPEFILSA